MTLRTQRRESSSLAFGGQALIEGVMFRSRSHMVMCVRQPNDKIVTHIEKINHLSERFKLLSLPFLRGIVAWFETLYRGVQGLYFSANSVLEEEEQFTNKEFVIAIALALVLASFFFVTPFLITTWFNLSGIVFNIVEALVRLTIFLLYLTLVSQWGEFKRILQYHGAEHKAINAHEAGVTLNITTVQTFSRLHPRCGTSLLFIIVLVSALLFSILPSQEFVTRLVYRVLLIPVIAVLSYELFKLSDKYRHSAIMRILIAPGLLVQRLITRDPDDSMVEVAVTALKQISRVSGT